MFSRSFSLVFSTGLAMFSMFFGAGNVVFPLVVGQIAGDQTVWAILGLLLTGVGVPFLGLIAILLFHGNYNKFFGRLGKVPGFALVALIMLLIGPFGGLPRCIALSYATLKLSWPTLSFYLFCFFSCMIIFVCSYRKNRMVSVLGYFLTPLLLCSLIIIIVMGLWDADTTPLSTLTASQSFLHGIVEGYNTMDLLASFFFSAIIFNTLKQKGVSSSEIGERELFTLSLKASVIGGLLLSLIYIGFCLVSSRHADDLVAINQGELLGALTLKILGPYAGLAASATIALACLTTAIALAAVFAEFLQTKLLSQMISFPLALAITLIIALAFSLLEFTGIVTLLAPILQIAYPALIIFTIANIIWSLKSLKTDDHPGCIH